MHAMLIYVDSHIYLSAFIDASVPEVIAVSRSGYKFMSFDF